MHSHLSSPSDKLETFIFGCYIHSDELGLGDVYMVKSIIYIISTICGAFVTW